MALTKVYSDVIGTLTDLDVDGNVYVGGWLNVIGNLILHGNTIHTGTSVSDTSFSAPNVYVTYTTTTGTLQVAGNTSLGNLQVSGQSTLTGNTSLGNLQVSGQITANGNLRITGVPYARIFGDFASLPPVYRTNFVTTQTNGSTFVSAMPNVGGTASGFSAYTSQGVSSSIEILVTAGVDARITAVRTNYTLNPLIPSLGTYLPLTFYTSGAEQARIETTGNVRITGNANIASLGVGTSASGIIGEIRAANDVTAFFSSDENLKENITVINNALAKVRSLQGVMFDWKADYIAERGGEDGYFVRKHDTGVIAQQVEKILPEVVVTRTNGYKAVNYEKMNGLIIQAINELADELDIIKGMIK